MTVKRFNPVASAVISLSEQGEYVKYEDYAALAARMSIVSDLMQVVESLHEEVRKECEELVADNVALKSSSAYVIQKGEPPEKFYREEWFIAKVKGRGFAVVKSLPEEYSYDYTTLDGTYFRNDLILGWMQLPDSEYLPHVETPATDSFLAEVRAQSMEMLADRLQQFVDQGDFVGNEVGVISGAIECANDFAAQFRKGDAL